MFHFDPKTHRYWWKKKQLTSVTQLVASYFKPFDAHKIATGIAKRNDPESVYAGMTKRQIMDKWDEEGGRARTMGTILHQQIENHIKTGCIPPDPSKEFQQYLQFRSDHPDWKIHASELTVWNEHVAGTIDCVIETPEGYMLLDWKRTKKMEYGNAHQKGLGLMKHADDCNFIRYSLQLGLYRKLWEDKYDIPIIGTRIVVMHESTESYELIEAFPMTFEAEAILQAKAT